MLRVFGDQIYIAALIELAGKTPVGRTWVLDRSKVMIDLGITDHCFEQLHRQIEARMPGRWECYPCPDRSVYMYTRLA